MVWEGRVTWTGLDVDEMTKMEREIYIYIFQIHICLEYGQCDDDLAWSRAETRDEWICFAHISYVQVFRVFVYDDESNGRCLRSRWSSPGSDPLK